MSLGILIISGYIILSVVVFIIAEKKGYSGLIFFFLSFFLTPILGLMVTIIIPSQKNIIQNMILKIGNKTCSKCNNVIPSNAEQCPYCSKKKEHLWKNLLIIVIFILLVIATCLLNPIKYNVPAPSPPSISDPPSNLLPH